MKTNDRLKTNRRRFLQVAGAAAAGFALPLAMRDALAADAVLKVGVIGSGRIGSTLGGIWVKAGHEVLFSSLDLEHDRELAVRLGGKARAGTPKEAAAFGEVLLMAVPYGALPQIGKDLGSLLKGKVVVDASNPFPQRDGEVATWAREKGAGLASAELLPGARIVRTFNAIGWSRMAEAAQSKGERIGMPIASDDSAAIDIASRLVREVGYEPVLVGPLAMGRYLMPGTPLAGEHTPAKIREIVAGLK